MPQLLIILALLAPFAGAIACVATSTRLRFQFTLALLATAASLAASIALIFQTHTGTAHALHVGSWPSPYGLVLVADPFSALMLSICQVVVFASIIFANRLLSSYEKRRFLFPLILTLSLGTNGAFLTGDLFNLYVWFEVLLLSSFALMALLRGKEAREGTWRYVVINLLSSLFFLIAAGLIYGKTGTLNFADLRLILATEEDSFLLDSSAALLFGAFGIKAALLPLAFWLPASYPTVPPALSALFSGLLTKVGLYAFFRVFGMVFAFDGDFPHRTLLLVLALITMFGGVLGAIAQNDMRRILSFHIISQVGYMALALALFTPLALAAGIFYLVHHIIVKANLFLVTGLVEHHAGSSDLAKTNGVIKSAPILAILFAVPALSLAGLPPLSGFFAKFSLLKASLDTTDYLAAATVVLVGLLTIFSMLKIWRNLFWGTPDENASARTTPLSLTATSGAVALLTITLGLLAGPLFKTSQNAANLLLNPDPYLTAVLGPNFETKPSPNQLNQTASSGVRRESPLWTQPQNPPQPNNLLSLSTSPNPTPQNQPVTTQKLRAFASLRQTSISSKQN